MKRKGKLLFILYTPEVHSMAAILAFFLCLYNILQFFTLRFFYYLYNFQNYMLIFMSLLKYLKNNFLASTLSLFILLINP